MKAKLLMVMIITVLLVSSILSVFQVPTLNLSAEQDVDEPEFDMTEIVNNTEIIKQALANYGTDISTSLNNQVDYYNEMLLSAEPDEIDQI